MDPPIYLSLLEGKGWGLVDLADVPLDILEKIASKLPSKVLELKVCEAGERIKEAAQDVVYLEYLGLEEQLEDCLRKVRREIARTLVDRETYQDHLVLVNLFGFLQVVEAEYRILKIILSEKESLVCSVVAFKAIKCIDELYNILDNFMYYQWTGSTETYYLVEQLMKLNSDIGGHFFAEIWDIKKNPLGPLLIKILECCLCSKFDIIVSHDSPPKFKDSMCCMSGTYELPDYSHRAPPFRPKATSSEGFARELVLYVWETVRWMNSFHVLRLRWMSMERALREGVNNYANSPWPLVDDADPYFYSRCVIRTKKEEEYDRKKRVWRRVRRRGEDAGADPERLGVRVKMSLWCPLSEVPRGWFGPEEYFSFSLLALRPPRRRRYTFRADLRSQVLAEGKMAKNMAITSASVVEAADGLSHTYNRDILI